MYLQITTKCNMTCEHCCYRCTMDGKHMTKRIWQQAIQWTNSFDNYSIDIGGGEPTLHPDFWDILGHCIAEFDEVWLATNGSVTKTALALAKMAKSGVISCTLSQDYWHDPIDERVVKAFQRKPRGNYASCDCREIRDVSTAGTEKMASFRDPEDGGSEDNCPCEGLFVSPFGNIKPCGCLDAPIIGNVWDGITYPTPEDGWSDGSCWKHYWQDGKNFFEQKYLTEEQIECKVSA